jgi:DNA-binding IscR family transcriptional regulator
MAWSPPRRWLPACYLEPALQALVRSGIPIKGIRGPRGVYAIGCENRRISAEDMLRAADTTEQAG